MKLLPMWKLPVSLSTNTSYSYVWLCSVRFVFGGTHGKLKYGPAAGFSPMSECLLPKQQLQILPCFFFGDVPKGILCGPTEQQDSIVFVPTPVNLLQVCIFIGLPRYFQIIIMINDNNKIIIIKWNEETSPLIFIILTRIGVSLLCIYRT